MSREVLLAGYLVITGAAVCLQAAALVGRRVPTIGQAISAFSRFPAGRPLLLATWLWAGWHFFARASWG